MENAGRFASGPGWKLDKSVLWLIPGIAALALFAYLLTLVESPFAGRAYAAYGGVYISQRTRLLGLAGWKAIGLDRWDLIGAAICLIGMAVSDPVRPALSVAA